MRTCQPERMIRKQEKVAFFTSPAYPLFLGNVGVQDKGNARKGRVEGRGEGKAFLTTLRQGLVHSGNAFV